MKKISFVFLSFILTVVVAISSITVFATDNISVILNGETIKFDNAKPVIIEERTLIPVRAVFEKAGWSVDWNSEDKTAIIGNDEKVVFITINESTLQLYDIDTDTQQELSLDVPATIIDGSTMIPLRAVCEAMGATVKWEDSTRTVYIQE